MFTLEEVLRRLCLLVIVEGAADLMSLAKTEFASVDQVKILVELSLLDKDLPLDAVEFS